MAGMLEARIWRAVATAVLAVAGMLLAAHPAPAAGCANTELVPGEGNDAKVTAALVCLINDERARRGLGKIKVNRKLMRAARKHSSDMVSQHYFAHQARNGDTMVERVQREGYLKGARSWWLGENIAWGEGSLGNASGIFDSWMNSPPHKANLLSRKSRDGGIGLAEGSPQGGSTGATFTLVLGKRS